MSRYERTGFRDHLLNERMQTWGEGFIANDLKSKELPGSISHRHRAWGRNCPAINLDCIVSNGAGGGTSDGITLMEYDSEEPVVLVEYKMRNPSPHDTTESNAKVMIALARKASLPLYFTYYDRNFEFRVQPLNELAASKLQRFGVKPMQTLSETTYVEFMYNLRNRTLPEDIRRILSDKIAATDEIFSI